MVSVSNQTAIIMCDAAADSADLGSTNPSATLVFYSGTPPINVDAALSGNTVLAQLVMSNPAYGAAVDSNPGATATAAAIADDLAADATGTCTFARTLDRGNVPRHQHTVGTSGTEIIVATTSFVANALIEVQSLTIKMPES